MGYEVIYHYRESLGPGEYDEEVKTKKAKVGQAYEETSLESLASKVMAQLARRNILIVDVEIYEFTRKSISYKESDDGILIKNKKFKFDDGPVVAGVMVEDSEPDPTSVLTALLAANPNLLQTLQQASPQPQVAVTPVSGNGAAHVAAAPRIADGPRRAKRFEVFSPELMLEHKAKELQLKLTKGKKYPIFQEEQIGMEPLTRTLYKIPDDTGKEIQIGAEYFVPQTSGKLMHEDEMVGGQDLNNGDVDLWGGTNAHQAEQMPDIRR